MKYIRTFDEVAPEDAGVVGGKGLHLGLMQGAGLPIPPGFCINSTAFREACSPANRIPDSLPADIHEEVLSAYRALGAGPVAVRSSATSEDGATASFAGQQETILGVEGEAALGEAIVRCWKSWESDRARAYRDHQQMADGSASMAVVVQRMVPAEVAGVLFTRDPFDPAGQRMLVEAAWGLGELIVSGRVSPDRFHIDRETGEALEQQVSDKPIRMSGAGVEDVAPELRKSACLDADQLRALAEAGRKIEAYYQSPRDVEWAWQGGRLWILQARPVTTAGAYERAQVRAAEIARLRASAAETGTAWARYNISEVLPTATPMTWAIVREFMSGRGGYGLMFRDLGYDPDPIIDREGFIDLICGRPYVNLSREPKQYYRDFPYGHKFDELKANPDKALYPQPEVDPAAATARFWLRSPWIIYRMFRTGSRIRAQMTTAADRLRRDVFPEFARAAVEARRHDLRKLDNAQLLAGLNEWIERTLKQFARESLKPSMFAAVAISNLESELGQKMGFEEARMAVRQVLTGVHPDPEADLGGAVRALSQGAMDRQEFLARFGWRGSHEMELAQPRWEEAPGNLPAAEKLESGPADSIQPTPAERWDELFSKPPLSAAQQPALAADFEYATSYLALRESAKHHLMLGYSLIRRHLLELDRRLGLGGGIFFLDPAELPPLVPAGQASPQVLDIIARRRREHQAALSLELPPVLFSDDLEAIGRTAPLLEGQGLQGVAVSAGVAEGPALVLTDPGEAPADCRDFVLVCPSTDPAWVPLFLKARALVMETGGVLSHGAIVAREFGLPAVVGIPQVHRQLRTGQQLRVDGNTGAVHLVDQAAPSSG